MDFAQSRLDQPFEVRREAVETLSNFSPSLVAERLRQIAWSDSNEGIREEAIESLADLRDSAANLMLLDIARNHPSVHTSKEALDRLQDQLF